MKNPFDILYEDNHLIIVNKPVGLLVQGDSTRDKTLPDYIKDYIKEKYSKPGDVYLGVIHRIDRPVSGVVAFARTSKALERMNELFRKRQVHKIYWAITHREPRQKTGRLTNYLIKNEENNTVAAYREEVPGSLKAELSYRTLGELNGFWLIEVSPITGRPHQIRTQLADMGCPIRGDIKYGAPKPNPDAGINLHARRLHFDHPVKNEPITVIATLPNDFWEQFLVLDDYKVRDKNLDFIY